MKKSAFTFIELIIVLAIISIVLGITTLKFSIIDTIGSRNEIHTFIDDYSYVREFSLSSGTRNRIYFTDQGYNISGTVNKVRILKHIKSLNEGKIEFSPTGFVAPVNTKQGHNLVFVSKKDSNIKWDFTIQAVGGYLSEKNK